MRRFAIPHTAVGAMSEILVAVDLFKRGYYVFRALASTGPFDLIAYRDGACLRVEVKTGQRTSGGEVHAPPHAHAEHDTLAIVVDGDVKYIGQQPADYGSGTHRRGGHVVAEALPIEPTLPIEDLAQQEGVNVRRLMYSVDREGLPARWIGSQLHVRLSDYHAWRAALKAAN